MHMKRHFVSPSRRASPRQEALLAELTRSLADLAAAQDLEARAAAAELAALMARVETGEAAAPLRRISILLEPWQIDGARLCARIDGGGYQERMRTWIALGLQAEAALLDACAGARRTRKPRS